MSYCSSCGAENEADAAFCESCGAPLDVQAPSTRRSPAPGRRLRWALFAGVLLAALAGGVAVVLVLFVGDGDSQESAAGGSRSPTATTMPFAQATATVRPEATRPPEATPPPAPTPSAAPPTPAPPLGYATPEEAIAQRVAPREYAGDCSTTTVEEDVGKICSSFYGGEGTQRVYLAGLTFSEFGEWLLLEQQADGTWLIVDSRPVGVDFESPWPVAGALPGY